MDERKDDWNDYEFWGEDDEKRREAEENQPLPTPETEQIIEKAKERILYAMLIVAVLCGGNGIGIVGAGLYWRATHHLAGTIGIAVGVTLGAIALVLLIVLLRCQRAKKKTETTEKSKEERKNDL